MLMWVTIPKAISPVSFESKSRTVQHSRPCPCIASRPTCPTNRWLGFRWEKLVWILSVLFPVKRALYGTMRRPLLFFGSLWNTIPTGSHLSSRHAQGPAGEVVPRFTDRLVIDRVLRGRLGPGGNTDFFFIDVHRSFLDLGTLNPEEDCRQAEKYLRSQGRSTAPASSTYVPRNHQHSVDDEMKRDALARRFMYTSTQQAAYDEVPWGMMDCLTKTSIHFSPCRLVVDSKLPTKLAMPLTTYEADGSDPVLKSEHPPSLLDARSRDILEYDRAQMRNVNFYRKPIANVAPLPRAQHISGYSGSIGGALIQDIDDPTVDFKPFTVVRTDQPKFGINPLWVHFRVGRVVFSNGRDVSLFLSKPNIPFYTGKSHWTKVDPVSHYDQAGRPYTTTAAFHK